jgi:hypothetical protein
MPCSLAGPNGTRHSVVLHGVANISFDRLGRVRNTDTLKKFSQPVIALLLSQPGASRVQCAQ